MNIKRTGAAFIAAIMLATYCAPTVSYASGSDTSGQWSSSEKVSINAVDADVRDVLSGVALNLGYSIIYNGEVSKITVEINDVSPSIAFDYLLKMLGMSYIREGNTLIVGKREQLTGDFARTLSLTQFKLQYINPPVLDQKIKQLSIPVTIITVDANPNTLWVQGFPADVGKVRELITALDVAENADTSALEGDVAGKKTISYVSVSQISAYEFNRFLLSLGIDCGISISDGDGRLWIYATPEERKTILDLRGKVDRQSADLDLYAADSFDIIRVKNISKSTAASAVQSICPKLKVVSIENASKAFFVNGTMTDIDRAKDLIAQLDAINNNQLDTTFFVYDLAHVTAAEAARRLELVQFGDTVSWYTTTHEDLSASIFVYCNMDYKAQVIKLLGEIDKNQAMAVQGVPVYICTTAAEAQIMQDYLTTMLGAKINGSFQTFTMGEKIVLFMYGSNAETVKLVEDMINKLESIKSSEGANVNDLSWNAFVAEVGEAVANGPNGIAIYGQWVKDKINRKNVAIINNANTPMTLPAFPDAGTTPTPPVVETTTDTQNVAAGMAAITNWFYGDAANAAKYFTTPTTDEIAILTEARLAVNTIKNADITVIIDDAIPTLYTAPTAEATGEITVTLKVNCKEVSNTTTVYLVIPKTL